MGRGFKASDSELGLKPSSMISKQFTQMRRFNARFHPTALKSMFVCVSFGLETVHEVGKRFSHSGTSLVAKKPNAHSVTQFASYQSYTSHAERPRPSWLLQPDDTALCSNTIKGIQ